MTHPPEAPAAQPKKGLGPLAWVAIGCVALLVVGALAVGGFTWFVGRKVSQFAEEAEKNPALAAARAIAAFNPEIEVVEDESTESRITFRNTETGETFVVDAEDVKEGRITFEGADGKVTVDATGDEEGGTFSVTTDEGTSVLRAGEAAAESVPDWVLRYPGAAVSGAYATSGPQGEGGVVTLTTSDGAQEVLDWYEQALEEAGYEIQTQTFSGQGQGMVGSVSGNRTDPARTLSATATTEGDQTQVMVNYSAEGG